MEQKYTKVEELWPLVKAREEEGQTHRNIGAELGLTVKQAKELVNRQNRKQRLIASGYISRPKGRPRKKPETEAELQNNELVKLRMQVELLQNFSWKLGRGWREV